MPNGDIASVNAQIENGSYEEVIRLPGPVGEAEMKVERKNGAIVVTLPKAYASRYQSARVSGRFAQPSSSSFASSVW